MGALEVEALYTGSTPIAPKWIDLLDLFRNSGSVDFLVLLSRFSIFFRGGNINISYITPLEKNGKSAKIILKIDEP